MAPSAECVLSRVDPRLSQHLLQLRHTIAIKLSGIWLLLHQRIKHIPQRHDAALQENHVTLEPLEIAGAINALMVMADHLAEDSGAGEGAQVVLTEHLADHLNSQLHMEVHHLPLLIFERALLKQDPLENADLADDVQSQVLPNLINHSPT